MLHLADDPVIIECPLLAVISLHEGHVVIHVEANHSPELVLRLKSVSRENIVQVEGLCDS